jgi:hypothetical protein
MAYKTIIARGPTSDVPVEVSLRQAYTVNDQGEPVAIVVLTRRVNGNDEDTMDFQSPIGDCSGLKFQKLVASAIARSDKTWPKLERVYFITRDRDQIGLLPA